MRRIGLVSTAMLVTVSQRVGKDSDALAYWNDHIGLATDPNVAAKSPARSAATVKAPVLLLHGAEDSVVPIDQSERMAQALQKTGKSVTFVRLPGDTRSHQEIVALLKSRTRPIAVAADVPAEA